MSSAVSNGIVRTADMTVEKFTATIDDGVLFSVSAALGSRAPDEITYNFTAAGSAVTLVIGADTTNKEIDITAVFEDSGTTTATATIWCKYYDYANQDQGGNDDF